MEANRQKHFIRLITGGIIVVLLTIFWPGSVAAQNDAITLDVQVGFDGYVQTGEWTPVFVTASNDGADLNGELRVSVSAYVGPPAVYTRPIDLPRGSRKQVTMVFPALSNLSTEIEVQFVQRDRVLQTEQLPISVITPQHLLIGVWSDSPAVLAPLSGVLPESGETRIARLTADELPDTGVGWNALDVLFVYDTDTGLADITRLNALEEWIAGGGRLIIAGGTGYQRTLSGLGDLSPVAANDAITIDISALGETISAPFGIQTEPEVLTATGELHDSAQVLVQSGNTPLIAYRNIGQGRVDFFAPDPGLEPLLSWDGSTSMWAFIVADSEARPGWSYGFSDENWERARQAVGNIPGVSLPSVLQLCGFLSIYVILIGPVNYLILWRLKKRELAWITIPVLVLVFSALAYITGFSLRGSQVIVHRLAVVQSWSGEETARVDGIVGVWSPRRARYDIQLPPDMVAQPIPGEFGAANIAVVSNPIFEALGSMTVRDLRVDVGGIQPLVLEGYAANAPRIEGDLVVIPESLGTRIRGDVINFSDEDLTDLTLLLGGASHSLPDLPAGEVQSVDVLLSGGSATPAAGGGLNPHPTGGYGYYYWNDTLAAELAGEENCYSAINQRHCDLAASVLTGDSRGSGVYLTGWSETFPADLQVLNSTSNNVDLSLHIVKLRATLGRDEQQTRLEIPPGLTTWRVLDTSDDVYDPTPYGLYLEPDQYIIFRFAPVIQIDTGFDGFILHMDTYGYGSEIEPPTIEAWNVSSGQWDALETQPIETLVNNPDYVDSSGGVVLRAYSDVQGQGVSFDRFDVTMFSRSQ